MAGSFEIRDNFYLNGEPFQIISGAVHYFRILPSCWEDRLKKLVLLGANTVETYIPWNLHEPKRGQYRFDGLCDIERFLRTATELGLYIILRPSPYICAEWEFGGLPGWLLADEEIRLRVSGGPFLEAFAGWYDVLLPKLSHFQIDRGGHVILMQVENEYGYFANDPDYLKAMRELMRKHDITVPLFTSDGPFRENLNGGRLEGALPTGNFGSRTDERFETLKEYTDGGPLMCSEFWVGWFDHWGNGGHMHGNLEESVRDLDRMLALGHVNIYMFEGGTNFGFMNGSNYYDELTPDVTSYDYDAVLTEDGRITEKFRRYREVIGRYRSLPKYVEPVPAPRRAYGVVPVKEQVSLQATLGRLSTPVRGVQPMPMERLGQELGYILYRTTLDTEESVEKLRLWEAADRAVILLEEEPLLTLYDRELEKEAVIEPDALTDRQRAAFTGTPRKPGTGPELDILVENMGRVNFGPRMEHQRKGIGQCVQINGHMHCGWEMWTLPLDDIGAVDFSGAYTEKTPSFYRFVFSVYEPADTWLDFTGWGKGCAFVNGFNIGRFWEIGPQKRLYIPAPLLKKGDNEIILFETEGKAADHITLKEEPDLG
ncbi:MAG: beta-galactosidase [Lachnospiraceae bacterium]|nr:beta-galactosidase [Lachnospiraceae bacterium]